MQVSRPNEIRSPGVRLHPKACAVLGLEAERATPKHLGTLVPRTCKHALGTDYARKSGEPLGFRPKEGTCASTGGPPSRHDKQSRWRPSAPPVVPRAALLGATSQDLARCKSPPLFKRGTSSCTSQGQRQGEPWGASPRPSAPTYLPRSFRSPRVSPSLSRCTVWTRVESRSFQGMEVGPASTTLSMLPHPGFPTGVRGT